MTRTPSPAGFTLLETLVVLIIIGIMVTITVVGIAPALERGRVQHAAGAVTADLLFAQAEAARARATVVVVLVPGMSTLFVRERDDASRIFRQRYLGADSEYGIDSVTASPTNMVEILPSGLARQNITFTISGGASTREVQLTRAGLIRMSVR